MSNREGPAVPQAQHHVPVERRPGLRLWLGPSPINAYSCLVQRSKVKDLRSTYKLVTLLAQHSAPADVPFCKRGLGGGVEQPNFGVATRPRYRCGDVRRRSRHRRRRARSGRAQRGAGAERRLARSGPAAELHNHQLPTGRSLTWKEMVSVQTTLLQRAKCSCLSLRWCVATPASN